jgi:hypothetical protein
MDAHRPALTIVQPDLPNRQEDWIKFFSNLSLEARGGISFSIRPRLLTRQDAATYLSISPRLFDEIVARGDITPIKVPGARRKAFELPDLDRLVDAWKNSPEAR